jgi:hypothetical protein
MRAQNVCQRRGNRPVGILQPRQQLGQQRAQRGHIGARQRGNSIQVKFIAGQLYFHFQAAFLYYSYPILQKNPHLR